MNKGVIEAKASAGGHFLLRPAVLDRIEQAVVVILFALLFWRVFSSSNPFAPLLVVSEVAVVIFVLLRRPTQAISLRSGDWMLATTATLAPLLIVPGGTALPGLIDFGIGLFIFGACLQVWAKLVLRRSFGIAPANRGVKVGGPYRFVRHPMYAGYLCQHIAIVLLMPSAFNLVVYGISWWAQVLRLQAEERLLLEDPAYQEFTGKVRWRLVPGVF